jgi:hypothetical protein
VNSATTVSAIQQDPWYRGPATGPSAALQSYIQYVGNTGVPRIPIEADYGSGTAYSHWDEGDTPGSTQQFRKFNSINCPALRLEIMTGFLNKNDYLTGLTAGALKDYGYTVNMLSPYIVHYPSALIPVSPLQRYWLSDYVQLASQPALKCQCAMLGDKQVHRLIDPVIVKTCMPNMSSMMAHHSSMSQNMCMSSMSSMTYEMHSSIMGHQSSITLPPPPPMAPMAQNNLYVSPWYYDNMPRNDLGCIWLSPYNTYPMYPTYPFYYPRL